jgi:DNA-binding NarL/FixJ family response regulator
MPVRVLIVDDDEAFREAIAEVLTEHGYHVVGEAGTVAEARRAVRALGPQAVLLDVNLPDGNGIGLSAELTEYEAGLRILLTSSDASAVTRRLVGRSGAAGFVAKTDLMAVDLGSHLG